MYSCDVQLLKLQKNAILEAIIAGGLNPADCELTNRPGEKYTLVEHIPSGASLVIGSDDGLSFELTVEFSEASDSSRIGNLTWPVLLQNIREWARGIVLEANTPDLWEELRNMNNVFGGSHLEALGNTPFTSDELTQISRQLREIKNQIKETYSFGEDQLELIDARFDEAEEASRRMGRKDWLLLFGGVLLTLIVSGILTPEAVQHVLLHIAHGIGHLFSDGGQAVQISTRPIELD